MAVRSGVPGCVARIPAHCGGCVLPCCQLLSVVPYLPADKPGSRCFPYLSVAIPGQYLLSPCHAFCSFLLVVHDCLHALHVLAGLLCNACGDHPALLVLVWLATLAGELKPFCGLVGTDNVVGSLECRDVCQSIDSHSSPALFPFALPGHLDVGLLSDLSLRRQDSNPHDDLHLHVPDVVGGSFLAVRSRTLTDGAVNVAECGAYVGTLLYVAQQLVVPWPVFPHYSGVHGRCFSDLVAGVVL